MSEELILLPAPQRLTRQAGTFALRPESFIWLEEETPGALLAVGQAVQDALALAGPRLELTAARGNAPDRLGASVQVDPSQVAWPEGYRLTIGGERIRIVAHDAAGAFYAAMTLRQIARQYKGSGALPCLRVEDWPDFPHRGIMLDISRDKVPTMETLYALVDQLAEWKLNQFQLYTEHTFAYREHKTVWQDASPMTGEQILALDAYCRARGIELVPNQNSFGHMERWLNHPEYIHLAEAPEGFDSPWGGWHEGPFSISPEDPGSLALLAGLYDELLPHFSSRQINVGLDETIDLGKGKSKAACEERGVGRVYLDFLLKIHNLAQQRGHTMQFWGDIIMHHPELIASLPGGIIALEWGYEANHPFAADGKKFAEAGVPYYVCPGTSSWNTIAGRTDNAVGNLRNAAENGQACGAIGFLNTDWGDNGHWQHLPIAFLGYAYGAAVSWAASANHDLPLARALSLHVFKDNAGVMGQLAYDLGNAYQQPGVLVGNASILFHFLLWPEQSLTEGDRAKLSVESLQNTVEYIDRVMAPLEGARMERPDAALIADEFRNAAALMRHGCRLTIARLQAGGGAIAALSAETRQALAADLTAIINDYRRLWLSRNRPGGLRESVGRMEKLLALYRQ